jgi:membrane-bound lytic murein transglycosylase D
MKKTAVFNYFFCTLFLLSCSQMRASDKKSAVSNSTASSDTIELDEELISKKGAENHELADANADDQEIKQEVGEAEIDVELPDSEKDGTPYVKNFLSNKKTKRMQFWVDYFTKQQRDRFQRFINNGEEYRHHIEKIFVQNGLPKELYFVGLIESGYYLGARSHAAAVGPWQFIKGTGKRYGLKISHEVDERQDLFKASRAAARYFKDLHNVFSSWELALSAYNAGEYGIIRRIMKHGTRDFYELSRNKQLPSETINYVPKVLAAMHVVKNAEKYGFVIPKKKHRLFDSTELRAVNKNEPISKISRKFGISTSLLKKLNPELRRSSTPRHFAGTYYIRVPQSKYNYTSTETTLETNQEETTVALLPNRPERRIELTKRIAKETKAPQLHVVKKGETILALSRKYKIAAKKIAEINGLKSWKTNLKIGQKLALTGKTQTQNGLNVRIKNTPIIYKVRPGDKLADLARVFDIKVSKIKRANNLKRGKITAGQRILLPDTLKGIYTVKKGDHLAKVARKLNRPMEEIVKLNALKREKIYPGQKIIVNMD